MDTISVVYFILFLIGFCFAVISFILGSLGHFGTGHDVSIDTHSVDVGGHDVDTSGSHVDTVHHDIQGHSGGDSANTPISPISPITIAMFITSFGGVGFILQRIPGGNLLLSLPIAVISGFVIAGIAFYILYRIFSVTQASSNYSRESVLGLEAEVITTIPVNGLGEIAYVTRGSRFNAPARSEEQNKIPQHTIVRMTKAVGNIFYVREIPEELLRRYDSEIKEIEDS